MYRIMTCKYRMSGYESLYQFETVMTEGVINPVEFSSEEDAKKYIDDYVRVKYSTDGDFIVVKMLD